MNSRRQSIVVVGSINIDLVCRTPHIPAAGETILGSDLKQIPGGKGANQAVAAARLAGEKTSVHMVGRVGNDSFGVMMVSNLQREGVDVAHVATTSGVASGCAMIFVDDRGENSITVAPGANRRLTPADIDAAEELIRSARCVVLQLEVPMDTVRHAIEMCRRLKVFTILDPAPVPVDGFPDDLFHVDLLTPNQSEAAAMLHGSFEPARAGATLLERGAAAAVLKLGGDGSLWATAAELKKTEPFKVNVVDTTAAGDAFTAALAVGIAEGMDRDRLLRFANAAGAICCESLGAQPALPGRARVERLMGEQLIGERA